MSDMGPWWDHKLRELARQLRGEGIGAATVEKPRTKTGPRSELSVQARKHRKAAKKLAAKKAWLSEGRFFLRTCFTDKMISAPDPWGIYPAKYERANCKIAKILDGDLWIRSNHACATDEDPAQWSKARNASPERLNQEIRQWGEYLSEKQVTEHDAQEVMDWLYFHLESKL